MSDDPALAGALRGTATALLRHTSPPAPDAAARTYRAGRRRRSRRRALPVLLAVTAVTVAAVGTARTDGPSVVGPAAEPVASTLRPAYGVAVAVEEGTLQRTLAQPQYRPGRSGLTLAAPPVAGMSWASYTREDGEPCAIYYGPSMAAPSCPLRVADTRPIQIVAGSASTPSGGRTPWIAYGYVPASVVALYTGPAGDDTPVPLYAGPLGIDGYSFFEFDTGEDLAQGSVTLSAYDKNGQLVERRRIGKTAGSVN